MVTRSKKIEPPSPAITRVFCGWSHPLLHQAADWLSSHARGAKPNAASDDQPLFADLASDDTVTTGGTAEHSALDLSGYDVVLPSSRAIDRLREILAALARERSLEYQAPRFYLVGRLPSLLYRRPNEWATDFEQTLAWARVLSQADPSRIETLVPTPPQTDATVGWLDLAATTRRLHSSLAAENLSFEQVLNQAVGVTPATATDAEANGAQGTAERKRWEFLVEAQQQYLSQLEQADRCDPNTAALQAITDQQCRVLRPIVLVGTTDLSELVRAMLRGAMLRGAMLRGAMLRGAMLRGAMLRGVRTPVTSLIAAPEDEARRFDEFGCLLTGTWKDHVLPIQDQQLIAADSIEDQAHAVTESLADYGSQYSIDQVTIGVTDESQVPPIENQCRLLQVSTYRHLGYTVAQTSIGRLIELMVAHRNRQSWRSLAALVRHADVHAMISYELAQSDNKDAKDSNWLTQLDRLLSEAFPQSVDAPLPEERFETKTAMAVLAVIEQWLAPLNQKRKRIGNWSKVIADILQGVMNLAPPAPTQPEMATLTRSQSALVATRDLLQQYEKLSTQLDTPVDSNTALEMLSTRINGVPLPDEPSPDKVKVLGWLDLALDDAPALVVCGLNHPFVPEASSGDPFLPTSIQSTLNQRNNDRRYARDVHAMHQMLTTRQVVRFIVGKRGADESPTPPSRLLAAATADDAALRVCRLLTQTRPRVHVVSPVQVVSADINPTTSDESSSSSPESLSQSPYFNSPPPPDANRTIDVLSVTAFSAYLACPYRFYLRHVVKLRPLDDSALELAANQFGDLVHGALESFGESPDKDEPDPDRISIALIEHLHRYAKQHYGDNTQAAIAIQVRQAERRLKTVAERQAERIAAGWRIHAVEDAVDELDYDRITKKPKKPTGILLDGKFTGLRGRFDRIDHHPETDRWAILDYKTHGHHPEKKHLKTAPDGSQKWVDLQLPLYRRFIPDLGIPADPSDVELGYFNVAEKDTETKINLASFTESQFAAADELIHWCVRQIRECRFDPNPDGVQFDDYEMMFNDADQGGTAVPDEDMELTS